MGDKRRFENKHVLITGGARGIGLAIATLFSREGARLTIFDYHGENLQSAVEVLGGQEEGVIGEQVDISDRQKVFQAVDKAEEVQPIDILVNNAGIFNETPFLDIEPEEWMKIIDINLNGMFHVSQAVCKHMVSRKQGVVINMSSKNGLDGESGYAHYNASKGGVIMLTKTMALELARFGIRVNAVCPGYIRTPLSKEIDSKEFTTAFVERYIPMDRAGSVDDVAPLFLFLASQDSSFMTGQTVVIDGGQLAGQKP